MVYCSGFGAESLGAGHADAGPIEGMGKQVLIPMVRQCQPDVQPSGMGLCARRKPSARQALAGARLPLDFLHEVPGCAAAQSVFGEGCQQGGAAHAGGQQTILQRAAVLSPGGEYEGGTQGGGEAFG